MAQEFAGKPMTLSVIVDSLSTEKLSQRCSNACASSVGEGLHSRQGVTQRCNSLRCRLKLKHPHAGYRRISEIAHFVCGFLAFAKTEPHATEQATWKYLQKINDRSFLLHFCLQLFFINSLVTAVDMFLLGVGTYGAYMNHFVIEMYNILKHS